MSANSRWAAGTAAGVAMATLWTHGSTLVAGFRSDDYVIMRRWTPAEVTSALTGSWDPLGYNDAYHRPVTALYQAALRPLFGLRPEWLHLLSLVLVMLVAFGLALFVRRESESDRAGAIAALLLIAHPMLPESTSAWIFNQMSLLADITVVAALLTWQSVRTEPARRWWPLGCLAALSFFIKEDGLMLVPALLALQWTRKRQVGDVRGPTWRLLAASGALIVVLALVRIVLFPVAAALPAQIDLYHLHEWASSVYHVTLKMPGAPIAIVADAAVILCVGVAGLAFAREPRMSPAVRLVSTGLLLLFWLGLPLFFIGGSTRSHLITLAAAVLFAGLLELPFQRARRSAARTGAALMAGALILSFAVTARRVNGRFAPCSPQVLETDRYLEEWSGLTTDLRLWLVDKRRACAAGEPIPSLPDQLVEGQRP